MLDAAPALASLAPADNRLEFAAYSPTEVMECNGCNGMGWNGMEWNGPRNGMEWNGMEWKLNRLEFENSDGLEIWSF